MNEPRRFLRRILGPPARAILRVIPDRVAERASKWVGPTSVAKIWSDRTGKWETGGECHWTELDQIQKVINSRVSGDPNVDPYRHFLRTHLQGKLPVDRALTLGCGTGELERGLVQYGFCRRHDAVDVAPGAIEEARKLARQAGLNHIEYLVADLNQPNLPDATYDVVFGVHSVHHIEELERLFAAAARSLKPGGLLFLNEFVGPSRFQWTDRQLEVINALLALLPIDLRRNRSTLEFKHAVRRPTLAEMIRDDPSEAVRSAEILTVLTQYFSIIEVSPYGGTVLQPLLHGIAGCFQGDNEIAARFLEILVDAEAALMDADELASDFVVAVATPHK